jgi:hypothetical protein
MVAFDFISFFQRSDALPYAARVANVTGAAVDCKESDGQMALFLKGTLAAAATVTMEESDDGSTSWTALAGPAAFSAITLQLPLSLAISATDTVYGVHFLRSKRYVRVIVTGVGHSLTAWVEGNKKYVAA